MGRLIDTESFSKVMKDYFTYMITHHKYNVDCVNCNADLQHLLDEQPTAYDVDKVVEELQTEKGYACLGRQCTHCEYYKVCFRGEKAQEVAIDKAIETVKQGIVSDDVCEWKHDSHLENDTPAEWLICPHSPKKIFSMGIKYCPYCGKRIKVVE